MGTMEDVELIRISYGELKNETYDVQNDTYGILSGYLIEPLVKALLDNPNYDNDDKSVLNILTYKNQIVGRHMLMPTLLQLDHKTILVQTGGGNEIHENFQRRGFGSLIVNDTVRNSEYPIYIGQLYSSGATAIYQKMNVQLFELPLFNKFKRSRSLVAVHFDKIPILKNSVILRAVVSFIGDCYLKCCDIPNIRKCATLRKRYVVKRELIVPEWIDQMTMNDGHKYMEVHNQKWLQWNLDNVFSNNIGDQNFYYSVYDKTGKPAGFFMTKERYEENKNGLFKNLIRGTVVEWGSRDETELSEIDLNLLAFSTFSSNVDKVNTVISTKGTRKRMEQLGYEYRGMYRMSLKCDDSCPNDIINQDLWRIRYGGCNTIMV